jgi:hypothetical protein
MTRNFLHYSPHGCSAITDALYGITNCASGI